jgi:hypothetical protein
MDLQLRTLRAYPRTACGEGDSPEWHFLNR